MPGGGRRRAAAGRSRPGRRSRPTPRLPRHRRRTARPGEGGDPDRTDRPWPAAAGWLAGLGAVLAAAVLRPGRGRPELVLAVGLLGVVVCGTGTVLEAVFYAVAGLGAAGRVGWGLQRLARVVLR
ncbi:MAG: hypothetical protein U0871_10490 [Gemmataceae bacterium]